MRRLLAGALLLCLSAAGCGLLSAQPDDLVFPSPVAGAISERCTLSGMTQEFFSLSAVVQPLTVSEHAQTDGYEKWWDSQFTTASGSTAQIQLLLDIRNQCSCTIYDGQLQYSINFSCGTPLGIYRADLNLTDDAVDLLYWERLDDNSTQFQILRYDGSSLYKAGTLTGSTGDVFTDRRGTYVSSPDLIPFTDPYIATAYQQESGYILTHLPTKMDKTAVGQTYSMRAGCWYFDTETPYDPNTLESYQTAYLAGGKDYRRHMRVCTSEEQVTILQVNGSNTIYYCEIDGERGALCLFE